MMRRFELHRDEDPTGVSGTGVVAEGVAFSDDGPVALRWTSEWPTSVVFHDRGVESLEAVHGHGGRTRIVWIDLDETEVHELTIVEVTRLGRRSARLHAHCSCGRWSSQGHTCRDCVDRNHREHVEGDW